ncbi:hypothetical protein BDV33DRAFT_185458 [Aspergillus novoparasiticus]|uniref:E3 ubiquitin ligase complex SCF subunit sconC n=1 Tax=Aspergillus novoparasiticus TaxID=986946 RepID=A0A5N6E9K7_9EURO|nr:hypothetical protein BDV33DRAFT_185458 [Aspergillus novoparasiticus]
MERGRTSGILRPGKVTIVSADGVSIEVAPDTIMRSCIIRNALDDIQSEDSIPVDVQIDPLRLAIDWCEHEASLDSASFVSKITNFADLDEWERKLLLSNRGLIGQIIQAANYLDIERLLSAACMYAAALGLIQVLPTFPQEICDMISTYAPPKHFTRTSMPNVESRTEDLCTRYSYVLHTAAAVSLWMSIEISEFHIAHLARENHLFLLDVFGEKKIATITAFTIKIDVRIGPDLAEKVIGHEIRNLIGKASETKSLTLVGVAHSLPLAGLLRYLLSDFAQERGRPLEIQFRDPSWTDEEISKIQPSRVRSKRESNIERRMASCLGDL